MSEEIKIAMWSGPRNISTALMYSFDNRDDCIAIDEPLYAHFLKSTGTNHPNAKKIIQNEETEIDIVISNLLGPNPRSKPIWYQKHMCHHISDDHDLSWTNNLRNCFLIRNPREVLLSLSRVTDSIDIRATGLQQQKRILENISQFLGETPPIVDSNDILENPKLILSKLCESLGIPFSNQMLSWEPGPRNCDGIWANDWYESVWKSSGFLQPKSRNSELNAILSEVFSEAMPIYQELREMRIRP